MLGVEFECKVHPKAPRTIGGFLAEGLGLGCKIWDLIMGDS